MMFLGAVLIALPVMISLLFINIGLGIITRAAPSLNIFSVGFPASIAAGFVILIISLEKYHRPHALAVDASFSARARSRGSGELTWQSKAHKKRPKNLPRGASKRPATKVRLHVLPNCRRSRDDCGAGISVSHRRCIGVQAGRGLCFRFQF